MCKLSNAEYKRMQQLVNSGIAVPLIIVQAAGIGSGFTSIQLPDIGD